MDYQSVDEITVFAVMPHTHLIGTGLRVRQFRNGQELPLLFKDDNYDFNFQETRYLKNAVKIKRVRMYGY